MPEPLLQPRYANDFHCPGSACEENCCQNWTVYVDKATYKKYRDVPALRRLTAGHIQLNTPARDNFSYARIRLRSDGFCPFLTADRLCCIHQKYGAEFLSKTCFRYPRALVRFDGRLEKALYLSCPEAARVVLLSPRLLPDLQRDPYGSFRLENPRNPSRATYPDLVRQLRSFALELLQDRTYPLWQRMFLLGIVCRRIQESLAAQQLARVPELLAQYAEIILQGRLRADLEGIPVRPHLQLDLVLQLIRCRFQVEQPHDGFAGCVADFLLAVGHSPETPLQQSAERYHQAYVRHYAPFSAAYPAFLENYLVNTVFRTRFPFADAPNQMQKQPDPLSSYLFLALHYRFLHSLLIGAAARYHGQFSAPEAVRVVQHFSRAVEHNVRFFDELSSLVQAPGLRETDGLAALLRN
ncbi:MAG TPA: flagellin lysine-N-methylase [Candidatus Binatia bacterium]|nr:flagellin lysine-N-methylase [Candidatus Binatia bacterium]